MNILEYRDEVLSHFREIDTLFNGIIAELDSEEIKSQIIEYEKQIRDEIEKLENLELRMPVIAPMKAGKSTIINSIIGKELLPSRNYAMTSLPTEIVIQSENNESKLELSTELKTKLNQAIEDIREIIKQNGKEEILRRSSKYENIHNIVNALDDYQSYLSKETHLKEVNKSLTLINDLFRLSSIIELEEDPLYSIRSIPRIVSNIDLPDVQHKYGKLIIVDTPGPNESGNHHLSKIIEDELKRSNLVIFVLDYSQLNTKASEELKKEIESIVKLRGEEVLYILVNKVDQRLRDSDLSKEGVIQFVVNDLNLQDSIKNRIFEVSAREAFLAQNVLSTIHKLNPTDLSNNHNIIEFSKIYYGKNWERIIKTISKEELVEDSKKLLADSGIPEFMNDAVKLLLENTAPKVILSALKFCQSILTSLMESFQIQRKAIHKDEGELKEIIRNLDFDIKRIEEYKIDNDKLLDLSNELYSNLEKSVEDVKKKAIEEIKTIFISFSKKEDKQTASSNDFVNWVKETIQVVKSIFHGRDLNEEIVINNYNKANEISKVINLIIENKMETLIHESQNLLADKAEETNEKILEIVSAELGEILNRAIKELNEIFDLKIEVPKISEWKIARFNIPYYEEFPDTRVGYRVEQKTKCFFFKSLVEVPFTENFTSYKISLGKVIKSTEKNIDTGFTEIQKSIKTYVETQYLQNIKTFTLKVAEILDKYRNTVLSTLLTRKKTLEQKRIFDNTLTQKINLLKNLKEKNNVFSSIHLDFQNLEYSNLYKKFEIIKNEKEIKNLIIVEGITDKWVMENALKVFQKENIDVRVLAERGAGANWVADKVKSKVYDRFDGKIIALFDNDKAGLDAKKELDKDEKVQKKIQDQKLKIITLPKPKHFEEFYNKGILNKESEFPFAIEYLFPVNIWEYAQKQNWLEEVKDTRSYKINLSSDQSLKEFLKEKGLSETESLYFLYKVRNDTKEKFASYVCNSLEDAKNTFKEFEKIIIEIKNFI